MQLRRSVWTQDQQSETSMEAFMMASVHTGITTNSNRVASSIVDWLVPEELGEFDMEHHSFCTPNFPAVNLPKDESTVTADELITPTAGEAVDEEDDSSSDEYKGPTEKQKRDIFKIHRGVGHPPATDFGRAVRHARFHRHLIRLVVK